MISVIASSSPGLLQALGINWKLLIEQGLAFVILVTVLAKFVYPVLTKAIDERRETIEKGLEEAKQSHQALEQAETKVAELIEAARKEADDIISRSHEEAAAMVAEAEDKARQRGQQMLADARTQLEGDMNKARETLRSEMLGLVVRATEHIVHEKLDERKDAVLIKAALAERERV